MTKAKFKFIAIVVLLIINLISFVPMTIAFFSDNISAPGNQIVTGTAEVELVESSVSSSDSNIVLPDGSLRIMPGMTANKSVAVKNTGTLSLYVRVKVAPKIVLAEKYTAHENEIDYSLIAFDFDQENWLYQDGYYYYAVVLNKGQSASDLFTQITFSNQMGNIYKDGKMYVTVRIEVVQASNNGENVLSAKGWATAEGGTL
jgi:hypothetical protein